MTPHTLKNSKPTSIKADVGIGRAGTGYFRTIISVVTIITQILVISNCVVTSAGNSCWCKLRSVAVNHIFCTNIITFIASIFTSTFVFRFWGKRETKKSNWKLATRADIGPFWSMLTSNCPERKLFCQNLLHEKRHKRTIFKHPLYTTRLNRKAARLKGKLSN